MNTAKGCTKFTTPSGKEITLNFTSDDSNLQKALPAYRDNFSPMHCSGDDCDVRFRDVIGKRKMLRAKINPETFKTICPTCEKNSFTIFRRDKVTQEIYLNHCKCENCGQLFIYKVDKKKNPILEEDKK